jgi:hypothetical protein
LSEKGHKREWDPFSRDATAWEVGSVYQDSNKKRLTWECRINGAKYFLVVYADHTLPPPKMVPLGFLLIDKEYDVVRDVALCEKAIRIFRVWFLTYLVRMVSHPLIGLQRTVEGELNFYVKMFERCETRISENRYENTIDPLELRLGRALKALDGNFVRSYQILTGRVIIVKNLLEAETEIWNFREFEKAKTYVTKNLVQFMDSNAAMMQYLPERAELAYESKKALDEYIAANRLIRMYQSASPWLIVLIASVTPPLAISAKLIEAGIKSIYDEITGYQKLVKYYAELQTMGPKVADLEAAFNGGVSSNLIRGQRSKP